MQDNSEISSFYTDHWKQIEEERLARYEEMFVWRDAQQALLEPANIGPGQTVLDVGSGPGFFAGGLAGMVGESGQVHGVDINSRFVADSNDRFADVDNVQFHALSDHILPFEDAMFDRVVCKNVLEYVPDLIASLTEVKRVVKPGGCAHVIDSDWGFVIVEPWSKSAVDEFFAAAAPAFKEPYVGRKVAAALGSVGFSTVTVKMSPYVDQTGRGLNVLHNMASYIRTFDTMPQAEVSALLQAAEDAVHAGRFLFCLPQFLVTAQA
jgi:ubiquinone/menaquinone biosynthesis C-methylase UbiE